MEKEDRDTLRHISETLDKMLAVLSKPQNRVLLIMNTVGSGITLLGIISIIEIIKNWAGG
jgi:adenosyl cobinamide kinase/adenosyl cobinamide phosphate guanylyltransferase